MLSAEEGAVLHEYLALGLDGMLSELRAATDLEGRSVDGLVLLLIDGTCLHATSLSAEKRQRLFEILAKSEADGSQP